MGAGSWESYHAITTLLFQYAECIDAADFDGIGRLFADAKITNEGYDAEIVGAGAVANLYRSTNRVHDDGTLRTRHLTSNVIVDIDEAAGTAQTRSAFVVFQATAGVPLQPIVSGRYRDDFATRDGVWSFTHRHIVLDHVGNVGEHLHPGLVAQLHDPGPSAPNGSS
jgi:3-phenylpropionate/cinnamic acid dioxygenase small subunit